MSSSNFNSRNSNIQHIRSHLKNQLFIAITPKHLNNSTKFIPSEGQSSSTYLTQYTQPNPDNMTFHQKYLLEEQQELGQGCHSIVKLATLKSPDWQNPQTYAVKICRSGDPEIVNNSIETFKNQMLCNHPFIIRAFELYIDQNTETHYLVMEHCTYPSLEEIMTKNNFQIDEWYIKKLYFSFLTAVEHMHERGICHRDIQPDNILIQYPPKNIDNYPIKLIDFGVSAKFKLFEIKSKEIKNKDLWTRTGTQFYCAPEIFNGGGYNEKVDIWAMGVILYQLIFKGKLPFQDETIVDTIEKIQNQKLDIDDDKISYLGKDLLLRMLQKDPNKRICCKECLLHPWFYEDSLITQQIKSTQNIDKQMERQEFFEKNKYYQAHTLKDNLEELITKKPKQKQEQKKKKAEKQALNCEKTDWEKIELGQTIIEDDDDEFIPIINISKTEQEIKKNMHIQKKQIKVINISDFRQRYTLRSETKMEQLAKKSTSLDRQINLY